MNQENNLLTIFEVSRRLNIPKHTLRFWEKEFEGLFTPLRTKGDQRRYTPKHMAVIELIRKLRDRGLSLSEIKQELTNGNKIGEGPTTKIDLFAHRVAEVVKKEVYTFLILEERNQ